jgi:type IV secretion system protein VirB4
MTENYTLKSDLLAKGMTKGTKIIGVPFSFALANMAISSVLMLTTFAITHSLWCFAIAIGGMVMMHLVMMILSLKEDKTLQLILSNAFFCPKKYKEPINRYTSLESIAGLSKTEERPVSKHIPWTHLFNESTVMTRKGELFQVLTLDGIPFHTEEDADIDANKNLRNRLLQQIAAPELAISFYTIKTKCNPYPEGDYTNPYAKAFCERYQEKLAKKSRYMNRIYIVLMHKAPALKKVTLKAQGKSAEKSNPFYMNALKKLDSHSARIISLFKQSGCERLGTDKNNHSPLLSFLSELINLNFRPVIAPMQALNTYLPYTTHRFAKRKGIIQITNPEGKSRFAAMLSLKEYPEDTHAQLLDVLLRVECELITTHSFFFKHAMSAKKALEKQQGQMHQTDDSEELADEISLAIEDVKAGRAVYGTHHLSICLIADSVHGLEEAIHLVESTLNQEAGLITVREEQGVELAFWAQLPGNQNYRIRQSLISSLNLSGFANLHNYPMGRATGNHWGHAITILETASGTPFFFNLHVGQVGNSIFIGPMGSGKTLLLSAFLTLTTKYGGWRYVFDKDRGMEVIVRALGGSYNILEPGKPSGMAPLQLIDTPENRAFNLLLMKQILSNNGTLSVQDEKVLEKVIAGAYELDFELRVYRHIAPFFGASKPGSLRERFDIWHSDGQNAWLFDNDMDSFAISNRISGYDIGKLLKDEYINLSTPALMYLFHRLGECLDSSPTAVFIPEGWKALSSPLFQAQLMDWSRTPRKNNMALIMDTQSPEELAASSAGSSIARESATQVFFANSKAEWKDYVKFNLTPKEFHIIKHVLIAMEGYFFLLKQGNNSVVARFPMDGMIEDIPVLSANLARAKLLDAIRARVGDNPSDWLPPYTRLSHILETRFDKDMTKMLPFFDALWEEIACA